VCVCLCVHSLRTATTVIGERVAAAWQHVQQREQRLRDEGAAGAQSDASAGRASRDRKGDVKVVGKRRRAHDESAAAANDTEITTMHKRRRATAGNDDGDADVDDKIDKNNTNHGDTERTNNDADDDDDDDDEHDEMKKHAAKENVDEAHDGRTEILVRNLAYDVDEDAVRALVGASVTAVRVVRNKKGFSRGFAFVTLASPDAAQAAMKALTAHQHRQRTLAVQWVDEKQNPIAPDHVEALTLFVSHLPADVSTADLRTLFGSAKQLRHQKGRRFAYVEFADETTRDAALALHGSKLRDATISVLKSDASKAPVKPLKTPAVISVSCVWGEWW
jgi:hypothetical protein